MLQKYFCFLTEYMCAAKQCNQNNILQQIEFKGRYEDSAGFLKDRYYRDFFNV